jgi:hypothetical protein
MKKYVGIIMQIQKRVPQCKMAWPGGGASWWKKQVEGLVSIVGKCMEGNLRMDILMMGK